MIIDHIGLAVSDYTRSKAFFTQAPAPLGIELVMEVQGWTGFGKNGKPEFKSVVPLVCGLGLMVFPYFVSNTALLVIVGLALSVIPYFLKL